MLGTLDLIMEGLGVNLGARVQQEEEELPPSTHSSASVTGHQGVANHNSSHRWRRASNKGRVDSCSRECLDNNNSIRHNSNLQVSTQKLM